MQEERDDEAYAIPVVDEPSKDLSAIKPDDPNTIGLAKSHREMQETKAMLGQRLVKAEADLAEAEKAEAARQHGDSEAELWAAAEHRRIVADMQEEEELRLKFNNLEA